MAFGELFQKVARATCVISIKTYGWRVYRVLDYVISHTFTSRRFGTANSETVDAENKRERAFTQNKEPSLAYIALRIVVDKRR